MKSLPLSLSVFFPVYNEQENLPVTVARTVRTLEESPFVRDYEILLIDDGSTDGSESLVDDFAERNPRIRAIHHAANYGYGEALKTGLTEARMDYVFFTDADLQFDIIELNALLIHLPTHPVVIGYRAPRRDPLLRLVNAWGWNLLNRALFGLAVRDIDCAFKVFHRPLVQDLQLSSRGAMISAEALIRLAHDGVAMKEVPVSHLPRSRGSATGAKLSVIYRAFAEMVALYRGELGRLTSVRERTQVIRFASVGVLNTLVDAATYVLLTRAIGPFETHLLAAKLFSFLAGTITSLFLNRSWTFGVRERLSIGEVARFYALTSLSLTMNVSLMYAFISIGMYDLLALVCTTLLTFGVSFLFSKFWVFNLEVRRRSRYATP